MHFVACYSNDCQFNKQLPFLERVLLKIIFCLLRGIWVDGMQWGKYPSKLSLQGYGFFLDKNLCGYSPLQFYKFREIRLVPIFYSTLACCLRVVYQTVYANCIINPRSTKKNTLMRMNDFFNLNKCFLFTCFSFEAVK
jgi:hypothetical protein